MKLPKLLTGVPHLARSQEHVLPADTISLSWRRSARDSEPTAPQLAREHPVWTFVLTVLNDEGDVAPLAGRASPGLARPTW